MEQCDPHRQAGGVHEHRQSCLEADKHEYADDTQDTPKLNQLGGYVHPDTHDFTHRTIAGTVRSHAAPSASAATSNWRLRPRT